MRIKTKIFWTFLCMALLVVLVGVLAVNQQRIAARIAATKEAENVAHALGLAVISDSNELDASAQEIVRRLHNMQGRDVCIVDPDRRVLADANPHSIGEKFTEDQHGEVAATIRDGKPRTFVETSADHPDGIRQMVAQVQSDSGLTLGAVILEYTPLYNELMQSTRITIRDVILTVFVSVMTVFLIAFYLGRSIAAPIEQLTNAATQFAGGRTDQPMPPSRKDEIGRLTAAFTSMMQKRQRAENELRCLRDALETRVAERTAELGKANEALRAENIERKLEKVKLTESELQYHSLFVNMLEGYARCRILYEPDRPPNFIYLEVNGAFEKLTGLTNVIGKKVSEVIPGFQETNRELLAIYSRVTLTGKPEKFETHVKPLGIWFSISVYSHAKEHFIVVFDNITERKLAENALRESNEKFRQLADNITDVFWITSPDFKAIHYISPGYELIWGRSAESLYANPHQWIEAILPEERERAFAAFAPIMENAPEMSVEYQISRPDGTVRWIHDRGFQVRDADGTLVRLTGVASDITLRKQSENALHESKHFAESMAQNSPNIIYLFDLETSSNVYSNRSLAEFLGYARQQVAALGDKLLQTIIHPEDLAPLTQHFAQFSDVPDGRVIDFEYRVRHASGDWHWIWSRDAVFNRRPNGATWQIMGTAQDITDRKQAEADLERNHKEMVNLSRQAGMAEVATSVLHNVGNVLNSVNVSANCVADNLLKSKAPNLSKVVAMLRGHEADLGTFLTSDPKGKRLPAYLAELAGHLDGEQAVALRELAHLQKNIEHIKDIVAMQQNSAKVSGAMEIAPVCDLVEDALKMCSSALVSHGINVIRDFRPVKPINIQKHQVLQILVNLIRNAKHACQDSERVDKRLTVRVGNDDGRIKISVMDNGVGIPPENLLRIFNHGFTTRKDGHGFGLHSGALAAKEMGGSLTVHSGGLGCGTMFTLGLPMPMKPNQSN